MNMAMGMLMMAALRALAHRTVPGSSASSATGSARFVPVPDLDSLQAWFTRSEERVVTLFLHDPGCPISAAAYRQMAQVDDEIPLVDVRHAKSLSKAVEAQTGVRHESPQVIVLRQGQASWSASHYAITAAAVEAARRAA